MRMASHPELSYDNLESRRFISEAKVMKILDFVLHFLRRLISRLHPQRVLSILNIFVDEMSVTFWMKHVYGNASVHPTGMSRLRALLSLQL